MVRSLVQGTSCLKVHSDSYLVLKKVTMPLKHMLQLDEKYFDPFWRTNQCLRKLFNMLAVRVCVCMCAQVCSESTIFFFPK